MAHVTRSPSGTVHCHTALLAAVALALLPLCAASTPKPIFSTDPATVDTCIDWYNNAEENPTCKDIRDLFSLSPEQFSKWNPSVNHDCEPWLYPLSYCVSTSDRGPPPGDTTTTTTTTTSSTATSTTSSSHVPSPTAWEARGCYPNDPIYPLLETMMTGEEGNPSLDISGCEHICWEASINGTVLFAGVTQGNQCWCSTFVGGESTRNESKCDMPCSGNKDEMCGGKDYFNVFEPVTKTWGRLVSTKETETSQAETTQATTIAQSMTDSGAVRYRAVF